MRAGIVLAMDQLYRELLYPEIWKDFKEELNVHPLKRNLRPLEDGEYLSSWLKDSKSSMLR